MRKEQITWWRIGILAELVRSVIVVEKLPKTSVTASIRIKVSFVFD
jgi:hypothetical protein